MRYLPINLDVRGRTVVIVGGGAVASRKCLILRASGASVTVIAPEVALVLQELATAGEVRHLARTYVGGDLAGAFLAYAATDQPAVNRAVADEAHRAGILVEVCTEPDRGDFTTPAVVARGDLTIAIGTGGAAPALAARIRRELEAGFDPAYEETVELLRAVREKLLTANKASAYNKRILKELADADLPHLFRNRAYAEIDQLLAMLCGPGFTLSTLGVPEKDNP